MALPAKGMLVLVTEGTLAMRGVTEAAGSAEDADGVGNIGIMDSVWRGLGCVGIIGRISPGMAPCVGSIGIISLDIAPVPCMALYCIGVICS